MGDLINRSFKFDGKRSFSFDSNKFTRSNTSRLASEIGSSRSARFATYEKLSDSMRHVDTVPSGDNHGRRSRNGAWRFLTRIFSLKKAGGESLDAPQRSTSWRPKRNSRWPVQGW
ncbi:hypothetical protein SSX86_019182 [Deinandra increscens subsp. villosa]|uniref:Uncharacterized protein n=1 Tax=Deinandra increscens subsp. villosa TaxID=3103831 RepID=A0AAP0CWN2_9ASTR